MKPKIERLIKQRDEARREWERAWKYADQVASEAHKRWHFIYFLGPARKRYERAVKALEKATKCTKP